MPHVSSYGVGNEFNQKKVVYTHNANVTIPPGAYLVSPIIIITSRVNRWEKLMIAFLPLGTMVLEWLSEVGSWQSRVEEK